VDSVDFLDEPIRSREIGRELNLLDANGDVNIKRTHYVLPLLLRQGVIQKLNGRYIATRRSIRMFVAGEAAISTPSYNLIPVNRGSQHAADELFRLIKRIKNLEHGIAEQQNAVRLLQTRVHELDHMLKAVGRAYDRAVGKVPKGKPAAAVSASVSA
jgi:hypothetical protein